MDWLSKRKFVIVCHEKVVRIPLEGDEILRVHGERTQEVVKTLMSTKVDEPKLSDIFVVRDFIDVFPEVLESLRKEKLYAKLSKCDFGLEEVHFLGRVVNHNVLTWTRKEESEINTSKGNNTGSPKCGVQAREHTHRKATWFRLTDGKKRRREFVFYGSNLGSIDAVESVRDAIGFECCLASSSGWTKDWESSLTGLGLVQETTNKVVLVKENPKAARDRQKNYVDYGRKSGKLAPRYVGPFEILERIGLVAYRLRLPEELNSVYDTFHVSNLKRCLADANLHVPLDEIKVDHTLHFVEKPVEIMDREIKKLKCRKIALVKVRWNLKRGLDFTWEHEDQMRIKYPQLFVNRVVEPAS
nr:putative reverse transcriptase domain-containing protein [Tanacetum cinerariifolium]